MLINIIFAHQLSSVFLSSSVTKSSLSIIGVFLLPGGGRQGPANIIKYGIEAHLQKPARLYYNYAITEFLLLYFRWHTADFRKHRGAVFEARKQHGNCYTERLK
jgi:hypothetical protein